MTSVVNFAVLREILHVERICVDKLERINETKRSVTHESNLFISTDLGK